MCSVFQLKNATTVLEYEKIAEVDFEKRDFRKVRLTCLVWSEIRTGVFHMAQADVWLGVWEVLCCISWSRAGWGIV